MKNNRVLSVVKPGDELIIVRAQNRILRLYRRLGRNGGWRAVVERLQRRLDPDLRLNISHVYNFVYHGKLPPKKYRKALYLPQLLPSERKPREKKVIPIIGMGHNWESVFFKQPKKRKEGSNANSKR